MKTKVFSMLLVLTLLLGAVGVLSSCGECKHENLPAEWTKVDDTKHQRECPDCEFVDTKGHTFKVDQEKYDEDPYAEMITKVCEACGATTEVINDVDRFILEMENKTYPWETTNLVMSVSNTSNGGELPSGGMAYVSGEWSLDHEFFKADQTVTKVDNDVLSAINKRNEQAYDVTHVQLTYQYTGAAYSEVMPEIGRQLLADGTPDIFYSIIYDMVGASIKGYFKNIQGNTYLAPFYEHFDAAEDTRGYNWDYMQDMTFSTKAMYLIASDYSFDIARAYFIMPVNGTLLQNVADITGDVNEDGKVGDAADFLQMVDDGGWTWAKIAEYTEAVKVPDSGAGGGYAVVNSDCVAGFAMSTTSGFCSTAVMYASDLTIITRTVKNGEYRYSFPRTTPDSLIKIFQMAETYIGELGKGSSYATPGGTGGVVFYSVSSSQVDSMFAADRLFVNIACDLGTIESATYQGMWSKDTGSGNGFVITPVAKPFAEQENYRTIVHNMGKVFAISAKASDAIEDVACAFINYQTITSSDILVDYFVWSLGYGSAVTEANVDILTKMSNNLKFGIDKVVEDALGIIYYGTYIKDPFSSGQMQAGDTRWHIYMVKNSYSVGEKVTGLYDGVLSWKKDAVVELQESFIQNAN